ncbi:MAG: hypothetical protein HETSPECPRED_005794 [Heterodermia speciosa]|uniref:Methyltransferase type 11 domain-containing protein n=1 Tax=Heterodermia speciosa TaxID=116794 RepID=A0A8H3FIT1_9LECA|nr:MAG: hypothetical protein HETSPECPRED_005794 [Heterodermia speciosa]
MGSKSASDTATVAESTESDLAQQYPTPAPEPTVSFAALKDRIRHHYELASDYYYSLWGEHIHHGYFLDPNDTKEIAQTRLIDLLLDRSGLEKGSAVLDVGCGIGGTSRYLARNHNCHVTGITISGKQVEMATRFSSEQQINPKTTTTGHPIKLNRGSVRFLELDAETMGTYFSAQDTFNCVWISEAMSHLPDKALFFANAFKVLRPGGKLAIADWFKAEDLTDEQLEADIRPIEDGMLLPPLSTQSHYVHLAHQAGFETISPPFDISSNVAKTWDISWSLIQNPSLWAFALSQGRDGIAFLQAFRAMRRGYANGSFRYAVMVFGRA